MVDAPPLKSPLESSDPLSHLKQLDSSSANLTMADTEEVKPSANEVDGEVKLADVAVAAADFSPIKRTAEISWQIREALRAALPTSREQFFTVMVPGKVVNFADYSEGFDTEGNRTAPVLPAATELNQAILCDDMPALSPVQMGPTGRSVAHSYDAAISKLVPAGSTVGVDINDPKKLTDDEVRYKKAMDWLTFADPENKGKTRIDIYSEKQRAYANIVEQKTKAYNDALQLIKDDPRKNTEPLQREAYAIWVSEHARTFRDLMQAAYMEWVVNGKKEEVEYWFSIVDRDSAMARVESSKTAMRFAVVQDIDGSVEYQKVRLEPSDWAIKAKKKALSGKNQTRTVEWYTWEITRLQKMNRMLTALQKPKEDTVVPEAPNSKTEEEALDTAMTTFIQARKDWQDALATKANPTDEAEKKKAYNEARDKVKQAEANLNAANIKNLNAHNAIAQKKLYNNLRGEAGLAANAIADNNSTIARYEKERNTLLDKRATSHDDFIDQLGDEAGIPKAKLDPEATRLNTDEDYFTAITVEVESASSTETSRSRASNWSFGASVGWGWWSTSIGGSRQSASSEMESHMSKNSCKISFECMRVDIQRNWLRSELFYDADLTTGPNEHISPGFTELSDLMEGNKSGMAPKDIESELERYNTFPLYPTAFLLAANIVLEITGETTAIQTSFQESVSSGKAFGYGPFISGSSNYNEADTSSSASCDATADGCRITIQSPQIIGWVSNMIPALPRLKNKDAPS
ncbi:hypothetical protein DXG01_006144 [Tephrocybe rancida]|nr:hypothetical protein DXG01_006144 [Tephrocybe rancida]